MHQQYQQVLELPEFVERRSRDFPLPLPDDAT